MGVLKDFGFGRGQAQVPIKISGSLGLGRMIYGFGRRGRIMKLLVMKLRSSAIRVDFIPNFDFSTVV